MTSEENATLEILDDSNFKSWNQDLFLLLEERDLGSFILKEKIKKNSEDTIPEEERKDYKPVPGTTKKYYDNSVTKPMLKCDSREKKIIFNSIKNELSSNLDFLSFAFEIYNIIKSININDERFGYFS
ncbi:hypothetical protein H8356DRAFT_968226 [Neocallimastix lanati (nom. inval.)]|nr:hypothetical protein H8356DRAFT_968226 [Neocallimastix sp. JGI-2020a]